MSEYLLPLELLIEQFRHLPGVGRKSAARYALSVLDMSDENVQQFAQAILNAKSQIKRCPICNNLTDSDICSVCSDDSRLPIICVVEDAKALITIEKVREYRGKYHVLNGVLSPMKGIGPQQLNIQSLIDRVKSENINEIIVATNPTIEGDTTALYLTRILTPLGVRITRPALGIPVGADIEYADEVTLSRAFNGRLEMKN